MTTHVLEFREVDRKRFEEVESGEKSIETRAGIENYQAIEVGDEIVFICGEDRFSKKVVKKYHWPTIEAMLADVSFSKVMPDLDTLDQVRARYASYPNYLEKIDQFGIIGLEVV